VDAKHLAPSLKLDGRQIAIHFECRNSAEKPIFFTSPVTESILHRLLDAAYPAEFERVGRCKNCLAAIVGAATLAEYQRLAEVTEKGLRDAYTLELLSTSWRAKEDVDEPGAEFLLRREPDP
jgi:hypothetical protein